MGPRSFWAGLTYPFRGFSLVYRRYPALAVWWTPPIVITFLMLTAGLWVALAYNEALVALFWQAPEGDGWWPTLLRGAHWLVEALVGLVSMVAALVGSALLSGVIAAPFNDQLSESLESLETGQQPPAFSLGRLLRDALTSLRLAVARLGLYLLVMGPLWILSWALPGVGQVVYAVFGVLFTALYLTLDYTDWPAARRGWGFRRRLSLARDNPATCLGFGAGVWVLLLIPLINLFFMPAAVAGGTRLFLDLEAPDRKDGRA